MLSADPLAKKPRSVHARYHQKAIRKATPLRRTLAVLGLQAAFLVAAFAMTGSPARSAGAAESSLTPVGAAATSEGVRTFMQTVAHDVTQDGPLAWLKFFDTGPQFFMAVNGQLAFPNAAAADKGTRDFARTINNIELTWGNDLRVDPLTTELAVVAASWREIQVDKAGHRVKEAGYFTGLAEYRGGRWRFRNAHWSTPASPAR